LHVQIRPKSARKYLGGFSESDVFTKDLIAGAEGESMIKGRKLLPWQFDQAEWSGK
jgi:hypothetical protein